MHRYTRTNRRLRSEEHDMQGMQFQRPTWEQQWQRRLDKSQSKNWTQVRISSRTIASMNQGAYRALRRSVSVDKAILIIVIVLKQKEGPVSSLESDYGDEEHLMLFKTALIKISCGWQLLPPPRLIILSSCIATPSLPNLPVPPRALVLWTKEFRGSIGDIPSDTMSNKGERRKHDYDTVKEVLKDPPASTLVPSIHPPLGRVLSWLIFRFNWKWRTYTTIKSRLGDNWHWGRI